MPNIDAQKRYVGVTDADVIALRDAKNVVEQHMDQFLKYFYAHLESFEGTRALLTDPVVRQRLLIAQRAYLLNLFEANFDNDYYEMRRAVGRTHFRLGLDFKWYVGAYTLYFNFFTPLFEKHFGNDLSGFLGVQSAFQKVTLMDMSIVLEAYHDKDKKQLEESNKRVLHQEKLATVGLLVSGLAHEIGNPLASIQAICDIQLRKNEDSPSTEKFKRIRGQVVRIVDIVRQLVNYARPAPAVWAPVNINRVLETSLEIARLSRNAKIATIDLKLDPDLPLIDAIEDQLSQVFLNIFLNALDALNENGGTVMAGSHALASEGRVVITIRDTGCGIPRENLAKIFEPFFSTKDVGKGTGLGLHVSMSIMQHHSGKIEVESEPGQGTCFTISLPIHQQILKEQNA